MPRTRKATQRERHGQPIRKLQPGRLRQRRDEQRHPAAQPAPPRPRPSSAARRSADGRDAAGRGQHQRQQHHRKISRDVPSRSAAAALPRTSAWTCGQASISSVRSRASRPTPRRRRSPPASATDLVPGLLAVQLDHRGLRTARAHWCAAPRDLPGIRETVRDHRWSDPAMIPQSLHSQAMITPPISATARPGTRSGLVAGDHLAALFGPPFRTAGALDGFSSA